MTQARNNYRYRRFVDDVGKCEMCGSKRGLEVHHIIPLTCANDFIDLDTEENWICLCEVCHKRLTPHKLLIKYGISKNREAEKVLAFYEELNERIEAGESVDFGTACDLVDKYWG